MKLVIRRRTSTKAATRAKRKVRIRKKIFGTPERPRLNIFRSGNHMYAQVIDDLAGKTLFATSSLKLGKKSGVELAKEVGANIAKLASEKNVNNVVFDRSGFIYHGRVKALAEAAREAGLKF